MAVVTKITAVINLPNEQDIKDQDFRVTGLTPDMSVDQITAACNSYIDTTVCDYIKANSKIAIRIQQEVTS